MRRAIEKGSRGWRERRGRKLARLAPSFAARGARAAAERLAGACLEGNAWHADHIVPVYRGGGLCQIENLRTLCVPCHQARAAPVLAILNSCCACAHLSSGAWLPHPSSLVMCLTACTPVHGSCHRSHQTPLLLSLQLQALCSRAAPECFLETTQGGCGCMRQALTPVAAASGPVLQGCCRVLFCLTAGVARACAQAVTKRQATERANERCMRNQRTLFDVGVRSSRTAAPGAGPALILHASILQAQCLQRQIYRHALLLCMQRPASTLLAIASVTGMHVHHPACPRLAICTCAMREVLLCMQHAASPALATGICDRRAFMQLCSMSREGGNNNYHYSTYYNGNILIIMRNIAQPEKRLRRARGARSSGCTARTLRRRRRTTSSRRPERRRRAERGRRQLPGRCRAAARMRSPSSAWNEP